MDECSRSPPVCHASAFCVNSPGSYRCVAISAEEDEISDADPYPNLPLPPYTDLPLSPPEEPISAGDCGTGFAFSAYSGQCEGELI